MFKKLKELEQVVNENEESIAYKVGNISITYRNLWKQASKLAVSLKCEGRSPVIIYRK